MKRSDFFKSLFGISIATVLPIGISAQNEEKEIVLIEVSVAGYQFYQGKKVEKKIKIGDLLELRPQFNNKYDENAIEVYYEYTKLGYVPRIDNTVITSLLRNGKKIFARVKALNLKASPWEKMQMEIFM